MRTTIKTLLKKGYSQTYIAKTLHVSQKTIKKIIRSEESEKAPFLCCPGPDVPFVLPRLLEYTQVKAVISTIQIGSHTAYPIVYYADPMLYGEKRVTIGALSVIGKQEVLSRSSGL